jgi:nitroreductase
MFVEIIEALRTRKSIRAYKPDPISREIIEKILNIATRAPSGTNGQPWEFTVITGEDLRVVIQANVKCFNSTWPNPDFHYQSWPPGSIYKNRQVEIAKDIFKIMGIAREDKEKRMRWMERGVCYFDAPVAIIISVDRSISGDTYLMDIGSVMQSICLTALNFGLGTCIEYQGVMYPDVLREIVKIPDSKRIIMSIALGYPDWDFPVNKVESPREQVHSITTWCGFENDNQLSGCEFLKKR